MSTAENSAIASDDAPEAPPRVNWLRRPFGRFLLYYVIALAGGAVAGAIWEKIVILPNFVVQKDLSALPANEGTLTAWFAADSWFSIIGIVLGLGFGVLSWVWFGKQGWMVTVHALAGAALSAFICVTVGEALGPAPFADRLATAQAGDLVPISLELHSGAAYLLWMFAAITPVMLLAAFSPDTDDDGRANASTMSE